MPARLILLLVLLMLPQGLRAVTCTVLATGVAFGTYQASSSSDSESIGTVTVTCVTLIGLLQSFDVALSAGTSGGFATRQMGNGAHRLSYNLYADASRTQIWGNGSGGTVVKSHSALLSVGATIAAFIVYGKVFKQQNVAAGTYGDSIIIAVNY